MQRWLKSVQKLRFKPSVTNSRPPSRTTRAFGVRSFGFLAIVQVSRRRLSGHLTISAIMA
jgi:hypothetical protein